MSRWPFARSVAVLFAARVLVGFAELAFFVAAAFLGALFDPLFFPLFERLGAFATFGFAALRLAFFRFPLGQDRIAFMEGATANDLCTQPTSVQEGLEDLLEIPEQLLHVATV